MPFTFKAVLNNKPKADGTHGILIRITHERKRKFVNTGESVKKAQFNSGKGLVRAGHAFASSINGSIDSKIKSAQEKVRVEPAITLDQLQVFMQGKEEKETPRLLMDYYSEIVSLYYKGNLFQTRHYNATLNHWKDFEKRSVKSYLLTAVDMKVLKEFEHYLQEHTESKSQNTRNKHLKRFKRVYKLAVAHGVIQYQQNPFLNHDLKGGKGGKKERLTMEEIKSLENLELEEGSMLFNVRALWLTQMYCAGARVGDMLQMKVMNIQSGRLIYDMGKTEEESSVQIPAKAMAIFSHYSKDKKPGHFIFPLLKQDIDYTEKDVLKKKLASMTAVVNKNLKILAAMAKINKNLTSHVARHTFADLARQKSKDIYGVSKALRHSSTKVTESYLASFDNQAVDDVMNSVFGSE